MSEQPATPKTPATPAIPKPSASLILLSHSAERPLLTLLLKRTSKASFMPNALVFPGGGLEEVDQAPLASERTQTPLQATPQDAQLKAEWGAWGFASHSEALAERRCALREAIEEAGEAAVGELTPSELSCVGRWLTPARLPKRFLTSFWCATLPAPTTINVDEQEVVEGGWCAPSEVLASYEAGELELAPPTIRLLHDLAALEASEELSALWREREPLALSQRLAGRPSAPPICPVLHKLPERDELRLCFPGDEGYDEGSDEGARRYEPMPSRPNHLSKPLSTPNVPWRLVMGGGL